MDLFAASIGGVIAKIYDDIIDNNINVDESIKSSLWTLSCFILALLSHNDFIHSFLMYFGNLLIYIINPKSFELNNEKSLLFMYPLLLLFSLPSFSMISPIQFILIILACICTGIEEYIFREETSIYKLTGRLIIAVMTVIIAFVKINNSYIIHSGMQKLHYFGFGYLGISCILLTYTLYKKYKNKHKQIEHIT
jgi:hypothetical protein